MIPLVCTQSLHQHAALQPRVDMRLLGRHPMLRFGNWTMYRDGRIQFVAVVHPKLPGKAQLRILTISLAMQHALSIARAPERVVATRVLATVQARITEVFDLARFHLRTFSAVPAHERLQVGPRSDERAVRSSARH